MSSAPALQDSVQPAQADQAHHATVVEALAGPGWCVIPNFLERKLWKSLAAEVKLLYAAGSFRIARVGSGDSSKVRPDVRTDRVSWIDPLEPSVLQQAHLKRVDALRLAINKKMSSGLNDFEGYYALYPPGCFYRRHLDRSPDAKHRTVSYIQYLNEDWKAEDGGDLRIYLPNATTAEKYINIKPLGGTAVFFNSGDFEHMVMPSRRERLSLTGWLCQHR